MIAVFYHDPVPGFIFTAVVCASFAGWGVAIALVNFVFSKK